MKKKYYKDKRQKEKKQSKKDWKDKGKRIKNKNDQQTNAETCWHGRSCSSKTYEWIQMYVVNLQHLNISKLSHFCLHNTWRWLNVTKCYWSFMLHIAERNITNTSCPIFHRGSAFVSLFQSKQLKQNKSCWFINTIWCWLNMQHEKTLTGCWHHFPPLSFSLSFMPGGCGCHSNQTVPEETEM